MVRSLIDELWDAEDAGNDRDHGWWTWTRRGMALRWSSTVLGSTAVVFGDEQVPVADDWGYGPPSSLSPERVAELAAVLRSLDLQEAVAAVPAEAFVDADIYPQGIWNEADSGQYLARHLDRLTAFFGDAADAGMGMRVWLN